MQRRIFMAGALALAALAGAPAIAHQVKAGGLVIRHPWTRATPAGAPVGGGYVVIENHGTTPDRLVGGSFARSKSVEFHVTEMKDGVMAMRPVTGGIEIPPGGSIEFKPGGLHMMFMGLTARLEESEMIDGTLVFEKAGTVAVEYEVQSMASSAPAEKAHKGH